MYCVASDDFWGTGSITVLCRHIKPVCHRGLKIAYVCNMKFIFTIVVKTIRHISSISTIQNNNSKKLWIAVIKRWYPLNSGLCSFTYDWYIPGCFWSSFSLTQNHLIFFHKNNFKIMFYYLLSYVNCCTSKCVSFYPSRISYL